MSSKSRRSSRSKKSIQQTISERFAQIQGTPKAKISKKTSAQILVEEDEENESEDEYLEETPEKPENIKNNNLQITEPGVKGLPKNNSNSPFSSPQISNQHDLNQTLTTIVSPIRETEQPDDLNSGVNFEANLNADLKADFNVGSAANLDTNLDALSTGGASTGAASVRSYNSKASSIKSIKNNVKNVVASFTNPLDSNSSNRKSSKSSKSSNSANSTPKVDIPVNKTSSLPKLPTKPKGILKKSREPPRNDQTINTQNQYQPDSILAESNLERNRSRSTWSFASQSNSAYADSQVYEGKWWNHRKVQDNLKFVFTFVFLIVLGMILLIAGLALVGSGKPFAGHFILIVMGLLFVIPACYYLFALYATVKGISGFRFYNLPLFN